MNPLKYTTEEFWLFTRVGCLSILIVCFGFNWARKSGIAKSFKIVGLGTLFVLTCMLLVISVDNSHAYIFGPLFSLALAAWFALDDWYFYRYPTYDNWLEEKERPLGTFGLNTWLGRLMSRRDQETPPVNWKLLSWKSAALMMGCLFVFALLFGFSRVLNTVVYYTKANGEAIAKDSLKTKAAIDTAVERTSQQLTSGLNSLSTTARQLATQNAHITAEVNAKLDRNAGLLDQTRRETKRASQAAKQAAQRASVPVIIVSPLKPTVPTGIIPLNRAKALPKLDAYGKPLSANESPASDSLSTVFVKQHPYPDPSNP